MSCKPQKGSSPLSVMQLTTTDATFVIVARAPTGHLVEAVSEFRRSPPTNDGGHRRQRPNLS